MSKFHVLIIAGWMSTMSWQGGVASGAFLVGTVFQSLISINNPSYERKGWQGTLFVFAIALFVFNLNIWCARALPLLQNVLLVLHVFSFAAVVILLFVVGRVQSASDVFTTFTNGGGWSSVGLSLMIGQVNAVYLAICASSDPFFVFGQADKVLRLRRRCPHVRGSQGRRYRCTPRHDNQLCR